MNILPSLIRLVPGMFALAVGGLNAAPMVDSNTPAGVMPVSGGTDWILDFSDEFSGTNLKATKWGVDVSTSSRAARTDRGIDDWWWKQDNVSLDGAGNLKLDVVKHDANTMYCGSVSSDGKYEPTYGYLEARIKIADTTAPAINSLSPVDGASGMLAGSELVLSFDESIVAGSGQITIKNLTDSTQSTIDITDSSQVLIALRLFG